MPGIKGIWTLQGNLSATDQDNTQPYDKYIILSFVGETRFLVNENNEIGESEIPGFQSDISTVYAANTGVNSLLQVTASGLRLVDITSLQLISEITTSSQLPVTVATSTESMIVYATAGGHAATVAVNAISGQKSLTLTQHSTIQMDQDIACASIYSFNLEKFKLPADQSSMDVSEDVDRKSLLTVVAFGMWTDNTVRLLAYPTLGELCRVTLGTDAQARSVLITELDCGAFLFVGLGDGTLLYYQIINNNGVWSLENKKKVVLGTRAISLVTFNNAATGSRCVFVASDCPSVIYIYSNKLLFSPVNAKDVTNVVPFHTELFPNHLALISDDGLLIGNIDEIKKVHIQTIMLNETPRRIAYLNTQGVFAGKYIKKLIFLLLFYYFFLLIYGKFNGI